MTRPPSRAPAARKRGFLRENHTWHLANDTVDAYLRDLLDRLLQITSVERWVWFPVGGSGNKLSNCALRLASKELVDMTQLSRVSHVRQKEEISFEDDDLGSLLRGANVLVIDSSVHSGWTMKTVTEKIACHNPRDITSYSLVVKRGSSFIPNYFGLVIDDHDRALFLMDKYPNNRMMPTGVVRRLDRSDMKRRPVATSVPSLNRVTWGDMWFEVSTDPTRRTYVYEREGRLLAYMSFLLEDGDQIVVDTLAVDNDFRKQGIGGWLLRWAETSGRCGDCSCVRLWAEGNAVSFYQKYGYRTISPEVIQIDGETYTLMGKALLHHLPQIIEP